MVTVVTRAANGIPLTHDQVDNNFTGLADAINNIGADVLAEAVAAKDDAVSAAGSAQSSAANASNSANAASISSGSAATSAENAAESATQVAAMKIAQYYNTIGDILAMNPSVAMSAIAKEYATGYGAEGGGWLDFIPTSTAAADGFMTFIPASNPVTGRWVRRVFNSTYNAKWAGLKMLGDIDEYTPAMVAINYVKTHGGCLEWPYGFVATSQELTINDAVYNFSMKANGTYFTPLATAENPMVSIMAVVNNVDIVMDGHWRWFGNNNPHCRYGFAYRAQAGGSFASTRIRGYNFSFRNCGYGVGFGEYDNDLQCSEINVFGFDFQGTPCPVYIGGANTGPSFNGCNIVSEHNANFPDVPECAILQEGGFWKVIGGSIFTNSTARAAVISRPCQSTTYSNAFGSGNMTGGHAEFSGPALIVENPRGLASPDSSGASLIFGNDTGFAGGDVSFDFFQIPDTTWAGLLDYAHCNWYAPNTRTGWNVNSASPYARIAVSKTSLGRGFKNWLGGVNGGVSVHEDSPILRATGLGNPITYLAGTTNTLKFLVKDSTNELARNVNCLNVATGIVTAPAGGWINCRLTCNIASSTVNSGQFYLKQNSSIVSFGFFNGVGLLTCDLANVSSGDTFEIVLVPVNDVTCDMGLYNSLTITAAVR